MTESPGDDNRNFTAWYDASLCPGVTILDEREQPVEKHLWAEKGIGGATFRLAVVPTSRSKALVYMQIVPLPIAEFRDELEKLGVGDENYSGVAAIKMGSTEIELMPREPASMKSGFGLLPILGISAPMGTPVKLPDSEALKAEVCTLLRAVSVPRAMKLSQWETERVKKNPAKGNGPPMKWPAYKVPEDSNAAGKNHLRECSLIVLRVSDKDCVAGVFTPRILAKNKYSHGIKSGHRGLMSLGVDRSLLGKAEALMGAASAFRTLKVQKSALSKINAIETKLRVSLIFPWTTVSVVHFVLGCALDNLRASTTRNYLSQIKKSHVQGGMGWDLDMSIPNSLLRGMSNTEPGRKKRIAVTPKMMLMIWEDLKKKTRWARHDRRVIWMLVCFLWAGSFRISEMLAPTASGFLEEETFTWERLKENVGKVGNEKITWIGVKLLKPKEFREGRGGVNVELFELGDSIRWCPVRAYKKFLEDCAWQGTSNTPVFRWKSGKNVTPEMVNDYIKSVALDLSEYPVDSSVTTHSFRAGVVSLMGAMGEPEDLIKSIGRWSSSSWMLYAKTGRSIRLEDQLRIQKEAAASFSDWRPVPVLLEEEEN